MNRREWNSKYSSVLLDLYEMRNRIDELGEGGNPFAEGARDPDQLGCYASNSIEGVLALLREMHGVVNRKAKTRKGRS
jgi:hypothetical protein